MAALAERYASLCRDAEAAWKEQHKPAALADPVLEAFRQLLASADGPLAIPMKAKDSDGFYSRETKETISQAKQELATLEQQKPVVDRALAVAERKPQNLRVHIRGNHLTQGDEVPGGFPPS